MEGPVKRFIFTLAFVLVVVASRASAQYYLNDPNATPAVAGTPVMLSTSGGGVATASSITFGTPKDVQVCVFTMVTSACSSCSLTLKVETQDPDGTWFSYMTPTAAVVATGTVRYIVGWTSSVATSSDVTQAVARQCPPKFRVSVANSAGTASYVVQGSVFPTP